MKKLMQGLFYVHWRRLGCGFSARSTFCRMSSRWFEPSMGQLIGPSTLFCWTSKNRVSPLKNGFFVIWADLFGFWLFFRWVLFLFLLINYRLYQKQKNKISLVNFGCSNFHRLSRGANYASNVEIKGIDYCLYSFFLQVFVFLLFLSTLLSDWFIIVLLGKLGRKLGVLLYL